MSGVNAVGRPRAITEIEINILERMLQHDYGVAEACRYARIGRTTYYAELERNHKFANRMSKAKQWLGMQAKIVVADAIINGDVKTSQWFLAHREPNYCG